MGEQVCGRVCKLVSIASLCLGHTLPISLHLILPLLLPPFVFLSYFPHTPRFPPLLSRSPLCAYGWTSVMHHLTTVIRIKSERRARWPWDRQCPHQTRPPTRPSPQRVYPFTYPSPFRMIHLPFPRPTHIVGSAILTELITDVPKTFTSVSLSARFGQLWARPLAPLRYLCVHYSACCGICAWWSWMNLSCLNYARSLCIT